MKEFLHHLFLPKESNNFRAKLLHNGSILCIILILIEFSLILPIARTSYPSVLGITTNITIDELLSLTNQVRMQNGLPALQLNQSLSQAASKKAEDMFSKNYWAHNAPDGLTPWVFIKSSGYEYVYAGENLAKGFTNTTDVVYAWMESPSHRDNVLSQNYKDIGFAVSTGELSGEETVLIVEMFGSTYIPSTDIAKEQSTIVPQTTTVREQTIPSPTGDVPTTTPFIAQNAPLQEPQSTSLVAAVKNEPLINSRTLNQNTSLMLVMVFMLLILVDVLIIERKKIVRLAAHGMDHLIFLSVILLSIFIVSRGIIL